MDLHNLSAEELTELANHLVKQANELEATLNAIKQAAPDNDDLVGEVRQLSEMRKKTVDLASSVQKLVASFEMETVKK